MMTKNEVITPAYDEQSRPLRQIRSFVRRQGRLTKGQQQALDNYWPIMGVDYQAELVDFIKIFGRKAPVILEIGFGMGASLVQMASEQPAHNFLGIEVHLPGVGACLASAKQANVNNLAVICHDAIDVLNHMIADQSLEGVQLFFPDPWHKARHHKRRLVQPAFVALIKQKLQRGGIFHMATDWQNYAEHMLMVMNSAQGYRNLSTSGDYIERPKTRPLTKFEQRGQRLGHGVWDLMFIKEE